jgi:hypothetical protein
LLIHGISNTYKLGIVVKQCAMNAFDFNHLMSADEVMASILHMARNMDEELKPYCPYCTDAIYPNLCGR